MEKPDSIQARARELRKNGTPQERHLWYDFLRTYPVRFRRQVRFGPYIADFYCPRGKLIVELDGSQHYEDEGPDYDRRRTAFLEGAFGLRVLRFTNSEVMENFEGVCFTIAQAVAGGRM